MMEKLFIDSPKITKDGWIKSFYGWVLYPYSIRQITQLTGGYCYWIYKMDVRISPSGFEDPLVITTLKEAKKFVKKLL